MVGVFLILMSFLNSGFAQSSNYVMKAGSFVSNASRATEVNLSSYFTDKISLQTAGTCHIYSATALIEAFCRKETGLKLDLSESYFFYQHLLAELSKQGMETLASGSLLDKIEGGSAKLTIDRFKKGNVCCQSEFKMSERGLMDLVNLSKEFSDVATERLKFRYDEANANAAKTCKSMPELNRSLETIRHKYDQAFRSMVCRRFDHHVRCQMPGQKEPPTTTANEGLQKCIQKFGEAEVKENPSTSDLLKALDHGKPMVCAGQFIFVSNTKFEGQAMQSSGGHAFIIYGYRKNLKNGKVEFLTRDSNFSQLHPFTITGCDRIITLKSAREIAKKR